MRAAPTPSEMTGFTVAHLQRHFADGSLTAVQLTQAYLAQIAALNPHFNAIIFSNPSALDEAREIDLRRARGEVLGPLAGIPIVVKDTMDVVGYPSTGGWSLLCSKTGGVDLMPATDSPVVRRMREAGCIILGKTNVPILSATGTHANNSWAGPTLNAVAPALMPGGSSAGTATAVAARMAVLGLAEETGGSIQNPAAAQSLVGIKPTFALVPNVGVMPLAGSTRDVVGPIARCVRDAACVLDVLAGFDAEDPKTQAAVGKLPADGYTDLLSDTALQGKRIGLYGKGWRDAPLSPETTALYRSVQDALTARGAILVDDPFADTDFAALGRPTPGTAHFDARGMECLPYDMQQYLQRMGDGVAIKTWSAFCEHVASEDPFAENGVLSFMPSLDGFLEACRNPSENVSLAAFSALRARYLATFNRTMAAQQLDALVFPQLTHPLPRRESDAVLHETTVCEINIAGLPAVTVPAGHYASGAPFGVIFVGRQWDEAALLALAYDFEGATQMAGRG